tara:strand:+ start:2573 stop:3799 length:1227 start_codon:yes stop_codon:yes gene_type:complete
MDSLKKLILKYGKPDALIDHWDNRSNRFAVWGFDEIFIYNHQGCYLNNNKIDGDPLKLCNDILNTWDDSSSYPYALGYISYDFKNDLFPHLKLKKSNNQDFIWFGKPQIIEKYSMHSVEDSYDINNIKELQLKKEIPPINDYKKSIEKIKSYLKLGETYQINYSNPKEYTYDGCPFSLYLYLSNIAKPKNGFYLDSGNYKFLSLSPEKFFEVKNNIIKTYPIKGTSNRSDDESKDKEFYNQLKNSQKDRAEHLMIVDLLRNDLGKISKFGTVKADNLYNIQSFESIHHMESEVCGELNDNIDFQHIIRALFPGGSITGAPKERSIEIIDELENYSRQIYTGAMGYLSKNQYMNFNIAIRTLLFDNNNIIYPVGGGIVWDSEPILEREEAMNKGKILSDFVDQKIKSNV